MPNYSPLMREMIEDLAKQRAIEAGTKTQSDFLRTEGGYVESHLNKAVSNAKRIAREKVLRHFNLID